jgi:hypothetical protein
MGGEGRRSGDRVLVDAQLIADHLLDLQQQVNDRIGALQEELLPNVRHDLGLPDTEPADIVDLVNTRHERAAQLGPGALPNRGGGTLAPRSQPCPGGGRSPMRRERAPRV